VIVDNGSSDEELAPIEALVGRGVTTLQRNSRNLGVAAALNQGLTWVSRGGYGWALTLDQDTEVGLDVIIEASAVFDGHSGQSIAVIGATWKVDECANASGRLATVTITSGALHSVPIWAALGGFREDYFVDYVDIEFCLRARSKGHEICVSCRPTIGHAIGRPSQHRLAFHGFASTNHSARRRYYITRNRTHVWLSYGTREPRYVFFDIREAIKEAAKVALFESDRARKFRAMARGLYDARRGRLGEYRPKRSSRG
jgi:rhamnosyltransferase